MTFAQDMAREKYPEGTRVQMLEPKDPLHQVPPLTYGKVIGVDEFGNIKVMWDTGRITMVDIARDGLDAA